MGRKAQQHTIPTWIQPASGSHTWGGKQNNTQSPYGYSPHRALTHGEESTTTRNPHMDTARIGLSHMGRKAQQHNPHMDTARIGLSHMGRKAQQHTIPTWIQPASGSHTWGGKHNTQSPHGYSPHQALTHGEESTLVLILLTCCLL